MSKDVTYYDGVWQDREVRFDTNVLNLSLRKGEYVIDAINAVEDTKGNNGERGAMSVTNLRIIWCCHSNPKVNLSIGLNCIVSLSVRNTQSKLRGTTQALQLLTKYGTNRFEFLFTSLVKNSPRLFSTVQAVTRAYETTRLYRDLKLRCAIVKDGQLLLLPGEQIFTQMSNVTNLAGDQTNLGMLFVTNIRIVWYAALAEQFNVSMPFIQIGCIRLRDTKFGLTLVIETNKSGGGFVLGFRVDPLKQLQDLYKELSTLLGVYHEKPNFGVKCELDTDEETVRNSNVVVNPNMANMAGHFKEAIPGSDGRVPGAGQIVPKVRANEDAKIIEATDAQHFEALASYYVDSLSTATSTQATSGDVVSPGAAPATYSSTLGLAIEELKPGVTLSALWDILTV